MVTNNFYVYIASNSRKAGNRTSAFTVTLPKSLEFNSNWVVSLTAVSYPHFWYNFGTHSVQYIDIEWRDSKITRLYFPSSTVINIQDLEGQLKFAIQNGYLCSISEHKRTKRFTVPPVQEIEFDARQRPPPLRSDPPMERIPPQLDPPKLPELPEVPQRTEEQSILPPELPTVPITPPELPDAPKRTNDHRILPPKLPSPPLRKMDLNTRKRLFEEWLLPADAQDFQRQRQGIPDLIFEDVSRFPKTNVAFDEQQNDLEFEEKDEKCDQKSNLSTRLQIEYNSNLQKFEIKFDEKSIKSLEFSDQFAYILGLLKKRIERSAIAEFRPELNGGIQNLYVYAPSLVEHSIVVDKMAPLLRIINIKGQQGSIVEDNFINAEYRKVLDKNIRDISFEIRDNTGKLLNFAAGDILFTLNFRKLLF